MVATPRSPSGRADRRAGTAKASVLASLVRTRSAARSAVERYEAAQLGDVGRAELHEGGHAEQLHRADDLVAQDLDGAVDPAATTGHQTVQVGAPDHRE